MDIIKKMKDDVICLELSGRLDTNTSKDLEKVISELNTDEKNKLLLDFTNIEYISSSGLRVILFTAKKTKSESRNLVLFGMKDKIKEIFDMTGFSPILNIVSTEEEAFTLN